MQDHGITDAFHGCGGDDSLPLNGHGLCSPRPQGVDNHLDVLLVDDQHVGVDPIRILAEGRVVERDAQGFTTDSFQTNGRR